MFAETIGLKSLKSTIFLLTGEKKKEKKHFWNKLSSHAKLSSMDSESDGDHHHGVMGHHTESHTSNSLDSSFSHKTLSGVSLSAHWDDNHMSSASKVGLLGYLPKYSLFTRH